MGGQNALVWIQKIMRINRSKIKRGTLETETERLARFWSLTEQVNECLMWRGAAGSGDRGLFHWFEDWGYANIPRRQTPARFAYESRFGALPKHRGKPAGRVYTSCGNPLCVNPEHLEYKPSKGRVDPIEKASQF